MKLHAGNKSNERVFINVKNNFVSNCSNKSNILKYKSKEYEIKIFFWLLEHFLTDIWSVCILFDFLLKAWREAGSSSPYFILWNATRPTAFSLKWFLVKQGKYRVSLISIKQVSNEFHLVWYDVSVCVYGLRRIRWGILTRSESELIASCW